MAWSSATYIPSWYLQTRGIHFSGSFQYTPPDWIGIWSWRTLSKMYCTFYIPLDSKTPCSLRTNNIRFQHNMLAPCTNSLFQSRDIPDSCLSDSACMPRNRVRNMQSFSCQKRFPSCFLLSHLMRVFLLLMMSHLNRRHLLTSFAVFITLLGSIFCTKNADWTGHPVFRQPGHS